MLASDAALEVLALTALVLGVFGVVLGSFSVSRALRRLRRYRDPGSRREYARKEMDLIGSLFGMLVLYIGVAVVVAFAPDTPTRTGITRLLLLGILILLVRLLVDQPIKQARLEALREKEMRQEKAKLKAEEEERMERWGRP